LYPLGKKVSWLTLEGVKKIMGRNKERGPAHEFDGSRGGGGLSLQKKTLGGKRGKLRFRLQRVSDTERAAGKKKRGAVRAWRGKGVMQGGNICSARSERGFAEEKASSF